MFIPVPVGIPIFSTVEGVEPSENSSYRFMSGEEALNVIRNASTPDEDYEHEMFKSDAFFGLLIRSYPNSVIIKPNLSERLQAFDEIRTDFCNSWNFPTNPVKALVECVISSIQIQ